MRRVLLLPLTLALLGILSSVPTMASGAPFKGYVIENSKPLDSVTGHCTCSTNWFTIGLNPGRLVVTAVLKSDEVHFAPTYAIRLELFNGSRFLVAGQAACSAKQKVCNHVSRLAVRVPRRSVYYISVQGPGGDGIHYRLTVQGAIRMLHCRIRCY